MQKTPKQAWKTCSLVPTWPGWAWGPGLFWGKTNKQTNKQTNIFLGHLLSQSKVSRAETQFLRNELLLLEQFK